MDWNTVIKLRDELVEDGEKRAAAIEQDKTVMTWICTRCQTRNAYWRNGCRACDEPVAGYEKPEPPVVLSDEDFDTDSFRTAIENAMKTIEEYKPPGLAPRGGLLPSCHCTLGRS